MSLARQTIDAFRDLSFQHKIETIADDLKTHFWHKDAQVVANSFGAYLFLHAQSLLPQFPGKVLILSPIVGAFDHAEKRTNFRPQYAKRLLELAQSQRLPAPEHCEIHVGSEDWQSNPEAVTRIGSLLGIPVTVVPGAGHMLGKDYVGNLLDAWLPSSGSACES